MKQKLLPILLAALALPLHATPVTAEGRAAGDLPKAREIALADALREAVRQGTGLDVLGTTEVENFTLTYDQVLGSAFEQLGKGEQMTLPPLLRSPTTGIFLAAPRPRMPRTLRGPK